MPKHYPAISPRYSPFLLLLLLLPSFALVGTSQDPPKKSTANPGARGVLRLRVRVKEGERTKGLGRKRFFLVKGTLQQNQVWLQNAEAEPIISRECFYRAAGASEQLIRWLKENDCESVYCRELRQEEVDGPNAVPEFRQAFIAGLDELKNADVARQWLTMNLPPEIRDGYYRTNRKRLGELLTAAETAAGRAVQSVMTDRNGTAYFTDLEPGVYVLTNFVPIELENAFASWNCEIQVKAGDLATERPFLVSNRNERNVKCVAQDKPVPVCKSGAGK